MVQISPDVNQSNPLNSNDLCRAMKSEDVTCISFLQYIINTATFLLVSTLESLTCLIFEIFRFKLLINLSKLITYLHFQLLLISLRHFVYSQVNSSSLTPRRITFLSYNNFRPTLIAVFITFQYSRFMSKHYFLKAMSLLFAIIFVLLYAHIYIYQFIYFFFSFKILTECLFSNWSLPLSFLPSHTGHLNTHIQE